ncbi:MAG TPA: tetratricopeptide repeat protein [Phototrophicaceae bacterium]|nr:tetratricopeptide repeat protein [Phototrophicaceae bacterium]
MIKRLQLFLGPEGARALFLLLATTGLISLILNAVPKSETVRLIQSLLVLIFVVGAAGIVWVRLDKFDRGRWLGLLAPAFGALLMGLTVLPEFFLPLAGGAVGWVLAGIFIFNPRGPMQYQEAVKHLRKNEYEQAVKIMDHLIVQEPKQPNHYRFRAELLRIWGKLDRAKRDYKKMTELEPDSAVAYNGLAEVCLQAGDYPAAREAALKAYALAPGEWVAAYNLGMIEDRLSEAKPAVDHLREALKAKVPDTRHRLLIYLYLIRAYARLGDLETAKTELKQLKKQAAGVNEWQTLFKSDQSETLRMVIEQDVKTAEALIYDEQDIVALAGAPTP